MNLQQAQQIISDMDSHKIQWDDNLRSRANNVIDAADPVKQAQKIAEQAQAMQIAANQPAIKTLQTQYNPDTGTGSLVDKYNALIDSITNAEQPAVDTATQGVNAQLAARGIVSSNAGQGNDLLQKTLNPITAQFGQLKANTGLSEQQDLGDIASTIAGLQAGNVGNALNFSTGISGQQNSLAQTLAGIQGNLQGIKLGNQFQNVAPGNTLVNTIGGYAYNPSTLTSLGNGIAQLK